MISQLAQASFAIAGAGGFVRARGHKSAHAPARFHHAAALQFRVDLGDSVGIDAQINRQLPHRGQLVSHVQSSGGDGEPDRAFELVIKRRRMLCVYLEH